MNIEYEKMLFKNDLSIYTSSIEGKELQKAFCDFKDNKISNKELEDIIDNYYTARNFTGCHYNSEEELEELKALDKELAEWYKEID